MNMTTTAKGSGDDTCAEETTVSVHVVASAPSQEESDEEVESEPSSQATKEVVFGELPSAVGSGEHDDDEDEDGSAALSGAETSQSDEEVIDVHSNKEPVIQDKTDEKVHPDSVESNSRPKNVPRKDKAAEPSTNEAALSPFSPSPPRPRKRGRALPTFSSARTSSRRKSQQQRSKEFSNASDVSQEDHHYYIDEDEAEAFLSTSSNLAYNWDALELGHTLGSAALNRFMARFNEKSPQLTAQQTLQIVNSLQLRTIMPPEFSALHRIIQRVRRRHESARAALCVRVFVRVCMD
jgi:hypothetical protein